LELFKCGGRETDELNTDISRRSALKDELMLVLDDVHLFVDHVRILCICVYVCVCVCVCLCLCVCACVCVCVQGRIEASAR